MRLLLHFGALIAFFAAPIAAKAADPTLVIEEGADETSFTAMALLGRSDLETVRIERDPSYKRAMTYRAVPLLRLLPKALVEQSDTLEASAIDGFVSQIPMKLIKNAEAGGAVAWLAIEDPESPWPDLPGKSTSAGPFYLIWQFPERSRVGPEQWPYAVIGLKGVASPEARWPQLAVAQSLPANSPERRGLQAFVKHCLACHKLNGAGEGVMGPDLAQPMSPTKYMTGEGLRKLIRDPASVRTWPEQQMQGFNRDVLPDAELEDLIGYLAYVAERR
jgi:mono/diheme cytochrome c family protein